MSPLPGQLSHDEFAELVNLRNELARRYPQVDAEALNAELMSLALYGRLSGVELRATAKRFIELKFGIGRYPARELAGGEMLSKLPE